MEVFVVRAGKVLGILTPKIQDVNAQLNSPAALFGGPRVCLDIKAKKIIHVLSGNRNTDHPSLSPSIS
jgi:hypothetical protein